MRNTSLLKGAGALLMVLGIWGVVLAITKVVPGGLAWDVDTLYALVDLIGGLVIVTAGWLAFRTIPAELERGVRDAAAARGVFAAPALVVVAGVAEVTAFAAYGPTSWTGIMGVITLVLSIPLWMTYRTYAGAARSS